MLLGYLAPSSIVISCVGSNTIGLESPIGAASCLASHKKRKGKEALTIESRTEKVSWTYLIRVKG
jgi:hypothetical protein